MSLIPSSLIMNESASFTQSMVKRQNKRYKAKMNQIDHIFQQMCEAQYVHHVNQIGLSVLRESITHAKLLKIINDLAQYGVTVSHIHYRFKLITNEDRVVLLLKQTIYVGGLATHWCGESTTIILVDTSKDLYKPKHVKTNHIR